MRIPHYYLYQVKGSKHYYFRVRWSFFGRLANVNLGAGHFVASLATDDPGRAAWLSQFAIQRLRYFTEVHFSQQSAPVALQALANGYKAVLKRTFQNVLSEATQFFDQGQRVLSENVVARKTDEQLNTAAAIQHEALMHQLNTLFALLENSPLASSLTMQKAETKQLDVQRSTHSSSLDKRVTAKPEFELAHLIQEFCSSKFREIGKSAQQQYTTSLEAMKHVLGDRFNVSFLDYEQAQRVKNAILAMPSGRKNIDGTDAKLSVKSVNKYLTNMLTFSDWLVKQRHVVANNPFIGCLLKLESKHQLKRRPFEHNEIAAILDYQPRHKLEAAGFRDAAKWLPTISLYTGMRLDEIASLRLRDVRSDDEIWFFDLSSYRLKTDNASRLIPIHSSLIERGLLDFVTSQSNQQQLYLFPELQVYHASSKRDGIGTPVGKWFNRTLLSAIGIDKQYEKSHGLLVDFHCCRHTVASRFKFHGVPAYLAKQILGHELDGDITWGIYSGQVSTKLAALKEAIQMLDY